MTKGDTRKFAWITPDIKAVNDGIHCWRVKVNHTDKFKQWVVYGVAPPNSKINGSNTWGITYNNCWYPTTNHQHIKGSSNPKHLYKKNIEVDILLDLNDQTLKIGIVGQIDDEYEYKFKGIPNTNKFGGWVPYFKLYSYRDKSRCQLTIAEIPPEIYGDTLEHSANLL